MFRLHLGEEHMTFEQRCRISEQCLPDAPYRAMLIALHDEMLAALAQPEQKPVAWMSDQDVGFKKSEFGATPTVPLYTTPPYTFARAIEAAIKDNKP